MMIEFLYFADCSSHEEGLARLRKVCAEESVSSSVKVIEVRSDQEAEKLNFIGSPTILINGRDIDPAGLEGQRPALTCRIYRHPDGRFSPLPAEGTIRKALRAGKSNCERGL
ncbi:MAG TPA: hypothetical protein VM123_11370 [archaeon]|nr:hypothetical protein [archaeon]